MDRFIQILENEILWLESLFLLRMNSKSIDFSQISADDIYKILDNKSFDVSIFIAPELEPESSLYSNLISHNKLNLDDRILLALAICPHLKPELLHNIFHKITPGGYELYKNASVGGIKGNSFRGILPTGLTFLYLAAGNNFKKRTQLISKIINKDSELFRREIIEIQDDLLNEPTCSGLLSIYPEYLNALLTNKLPETEKKEVKNAI